MLELRRFPAVNVEKCLICGNKGKFFVGEFDNKDNNRIMSWHSDIRLCDDDKCWEYYKLLKC